MGKAKGAISETEWNRGRSAAGSPEKAGAIIEALEEVAPGALSMAAIGQKSGITWPYSTVKELVKSGTLEQKKIGKAMYYRLKRKKKTA